MYKLFLDDIREPLDCCSYMLNKDFYSDNEFVVVRNYEEIVDARTRLKETLDLFKTIKIKYDKPIKNGFEYISSILESRFIENTDRFTPFYRIHKSKSKG